MVLARMRLRVLVVHSYYSSRQSSGENRAVDQQVMALRSAGHEVVVEARRTDHLERSPFYEVKSAIHVASGVGPSPLGAIQRFRPDIVHVHNLFPNYGRSWVSKVDAPVVATLHNFRPLCPAGTLYRSGAACFDCLEARHAWPAMKHRCYRGSAAKTSPLALSTRFDRDPILQHADLLLALNGRMREAYESAGVAPERLRVSRNFLPEEFDEGPGKGGGSWLFVGRLSPEKRIVELVAGWPPNEPLTIIGTGPNEDSVRRISPPNVSFLGDLPADAVRSAMRDAVGLVFPSLWPEGPPLVYVEALAAGTPVLAWPSTPTGDLVASHGTGAVVGGPLAESLAEARRSFPHLRGHCRAVFEAEHSQSAWLHMMNDFYSALLY